MAAQASTAAFANLLPRSATLTTATKYTKERNSVKILEESTELRIQTFRTFGCQSRFRLSAVNSDGDVGFDKNL